MHRIKLHITLAKLKSEVENCKKKLYVGLQIDFYALKMIQYANIIFLFSQIINKPYAYVGSLLVHSFTALGFSFCKPLEEKKFGIFFFQWEHKTK